MIGRISGILVEKQPPQIVVDVGGIGYEVDVSMQSFFRLPECGQKVTLITHLVVREDAQLLYGFTSREERNAFRQLLKVNGIGAKIALAVLSVLSGDELAAAVAQEDVAALCAVPGIGKKTAERLLLELRGKIRASGAATLQGAAAVSAPVNAEVRAALLALGYNEREAAAAVKSLPEDIAVGEGVRMALKQLAPASAKSTD